MLKKQYRLPAYVRSPKASSFAEPLFVVKIARNDFDHNRFGFVVSKKIDKRATVRNRIRRIFRSCIEEMFKEIGAGHDMLFILKSGILEIKREELYNQVHDFFKKRNLLK